MISFQSFILLVKRIYFVSNNSLRSDLIKLYTHFPWGDREILSKIRLSWRLIDIKTRLLWLWDLRLFIEFKLAHFSYKLLRDSKSKVSFDYWIACHLKGVWIQFCLKYLIDSKFSTSKLFDNWSVMLENSKCGLHKN